MIQLKTIYNSLIYILKSSYLIRTCVSECVEDSDLEMLWSVLTVMHDSESVTHSLVCHLWLKK